MRILIQRIASGWVEWEGTATERAETGMLCLIGFHRADTRDVLEPMAEKLLHLRIFEDHNGRMNHALQDVRGRLIIVPQFTLHADCRKGRRPSFTDAMEPETAREYFQEFLRICRETQPDLIAGEFGTHMNVHLVNDGPVTFLLDSRELIS